MRIQELTGYRKNPAYQAAQQLSRDASSVEYESALEKFTQRITELGYQLEHIGSGLFANVFVRPNDPYVIKIFVKDPGYLKYVQYCLKHQDNPHVPRFRGGLISLDNNSYAVRIERLESFQGNKDQDLARIGNEITKGYQVFSQLVSNATIQEYSPQLHQLFRDLASLFGGSRYTDLTANNIMVRGGKTLVITDPVS